MADIKTYKLDAAFTSLESFDGFNDPGAFIEVALLAIASELEQQP